jgi:hypothetical protein
MASSNRSLPRNTELLVPIEENKVTADGVMKVLKYRTSEYGTA